MSRVIWRLHSYGAYALHVWRIYYMRPHSLGLIWHSIEKVRTPQPCILSCANAIMPDRGYCVLQKIYESVEPCNFSKVACISILLSAYCFCFRLIDNFRSMQTRLRYIVNQYEDLKRQLNDNMSVFKNLDQQLNECKANMLQNKKLRDDKIA